MAEITKTINIDVQSKQAEAEVKRIDSQLRSIDKDAGKATKGVGSVTKSFKGLGVAIKAAGIGLVIAAFAKLTEIFQKNQKVTDAFNIAFESLSIAFNDFVNFILNNGGKVCPSCGKTNCGCGYNHGGTVGPLGRSQMRTPTAIAHAKAYDYYNKAASARRDPFGMYFGKQMVRSFPGEAPLSIKERIVDPLKAKSPTLFGRINLGK